MKKTLTTGIAAALGMLVLILDTPTAIAAGQQAVTLCLMTVIPSLFPFFLLSNLLNASFMGYRSKHLSKLGKLLKIPQGCESLFLVGLLGGYPTGAKAVADAYRNGCISKKDGRRLLGFCNNAGPSFLFGIVGAYFTSWTTVFALWLIHILSAVCVGITLPGKNGETKKAIISDPITLPQALKQSILTMAQVCGWILVFRVVFAYCSRWFLWLLPQQAQVFLSGVLEITMGATALSVFLGEWLRFMIAGIFLAFGGLCVTMQTLSITGDLGVGMYLPGKGLQCIYCLLFSGIYLYLTENLTCSSGKTVWLLTILCAMVAAVLALIASVKKRGRIFSKLRV